VVLSRKTLKFGGDAFGDSLSGPLGLPGGAGWYIQESDMVEIQVVKSSWALRPFRLQG
jgi:hypothetical protein